MSTIKSSMAATAAGVGARAVLGWLWPGQPAKDPSQSGTSWAAAVSWAASAAAAAAAARLSARYFAES